MKCPDCGMENYAEATVCNCGHLFYSSLSPDPGTRKCLSCGRENPTATQTCECGQDPTAVPVERVSNQENEEVPAETRRKAHLDAHSQLKKSLGLTRFAQSVLVLFATAAGIKALSGFLIAIIYGGRIRELVWLLRFSASAWDSTELNLVLVASATLSFVLVWMWITSASKSALLLGLLNRETADLQYSSLAKNYFRPFWGISQKVRHMKDLYEAVLDTWSKKDAQHTAGQSSTNRSTGVTISVWTLLYV